MVYVTGAGNTTAKGNSGAFAEPSLARIVLSIETSAGKQAALQHILNALQVMANIYTKVTEHAFTLLQFGVTVQCKCVLYGNGVTVQCKCALYGNGVTLQFKCVLYGNGVTVQCVYSTVAVLQSSVCTLR